MTAKLHRFSGCAGAAGAPARPPTVARAASPWVRQHTARMAVPRAGAPARPPTVARAASPWVRQHTARMAVPRAGAPARRRLRSPGEGARGSLQRAGVLGGAALVLAWTSVAPFLWVVETPREKADGPPAVRVVISAGLERAPARKDASDSKDQVQPGAKDEGQAGAKAPAAPRLRQAVSTDLDQLTPRTPVAIPAEAGLPVPAVSAAPAPAAIGTTPVLPARVAAGPPAQAPRPPPAL